jgi:hypothetical protein
MDDKSLTTTACTARIPGRSRGNRGPGGRRLLDLHQPPSNRKNDSMGSVIGLELVD